MTDMADRELLEAKGDPVLDAYVKKHGARPSTNMRDLIRWTERLHDWRSAWQEATLVEREWFPIETAPKDGTVILLGSKGGTWIGKYLPVYASGFKPENHGRA